MLSERILPGRPTTRPVGQKRVRDRQRRLHLVTGMIVVAYVYATPAPGSGLTWGVRWLVLPALAATGLLMWQWPRLRRLTRQRRARP